MTPIARALRIFNACPETHEWALRFETVEEAWGACPRGEWLVAAITRADRCYSPRLQELLKSLSRLVDPPLTLPAFEGVRPDSVVWGWTSLLLDLLVQEVPTRNQQAAVASARLADEVRKVVPALLPAPVAPHRINTWGRKGRETLRKTRGGLDPLMGGE